MSVEVAIEVLAYVFVSLEEGATQLGEDKRDIYLIGEKRGQMTYLSSHNPLATARSRLTSISSVPSE